MNKNNLPDLKKRQTLKSLTAISSSALLFGIPSFAIASGSRSTTANTPAAPATNEGILDCTLISRADISRIHLLMHNRTDTEIVAAHFMQQAVQFDDTVLNLANTYKNNLVIAPQDKVMVRLKLEEDTSSSLTYKYIIDLNAQREYLPLGTRVVSIKVLATNGLCQIIHTPYNTPGNTPLPA